jgi:hypothetical protein
MSLDKQFPVQTRNQAHRILEAQEAIYPRSPQPTKSLKPEGVFSLEAQDAIFIRKMIFESRHERSFN